MDWKSFYRKDLLSPEGWAAMRLAFRDAPPVDPVLDAALSRGAVSFPHTYLRASVPSIARVVEAIYRSGADRVVALGVLHGGVLESPHRERIIAYRDDMLDPDLSSMERREIFSRYGGAFLGERPVETPFGSLRTLDVEAPELPVRRDADLLKNEFSLDLFLALLALRGAERGRTPPRVLPLYVGLVLDPGGRLDTAEHLAWGLRRRAGNAVFVATGDVVHYGHGYSTAEDMAGKPAEPGALAAWFRPQLERSLWRALGGKDLADVFAHGVGTLRSDQVNVLPVIAALLGGRGRADIVEFSWADYSDILGQEPPCLVASALTAFST